MFPRSNSTRLTTAGGLLLALVGAVQPVTAADRPFYTNRTTFLIPFAPDPGAAGIQQVILNVSENNPRNYREVARVGPNERSFKFTATQDGWYYFAVQTQDTTNRLFPPNLVDVRPGLTVCVDTRPPDISVKSVPTTDGSTAVDYNISEANPDAFTLRAEYRAVGQKDWLALNFVARLPIGQITWHPAMNGPWEVRVQMRDLAGNQGEKVIIVTPGGTGQPAFDPRTPTNPAVADVTFVSAMRFQLNYKLDNVGKSGVRSLDIWITEDQGRTHRRYQQVPIQPGQPTDKPIDVEVKKDGRYGFWIVPVSGVGLLEEPRNPTQPQVWIEVDTTPPVVRLIRPPVVGVGAEANKVTIYYEATDNKLLRDRPITISYRTKDGSKWEEVVKDVANNGVYEWLTQESTPLEFYIRVEAVDQAGNTGSAETTQTVKVDGSVPKAGNIKVIVPGKTMP